MTSATYQQVANIVNRPETVRVNLPGGISTFPEYRLWDSRINGLVVEDRPTNTSERRKTELAFAHRAIGAGAAALKVVVAADSNPGSLAAAGLLARKTRRPLLAGSEGVASGATAAEYLKIANGVIGTLVGRSATQGRADEFSALVGSGTSNYSGFQAINTTLSGSQFSVSLVAVSGATSYRAYGDGGVVLGTSNSTTLTISGAPQPMEIRALSSTGAVLGAFQYEITQYDTAAQRDGAVTVSVIPTGAANRAVIQILGPSNLPRVIVRSSTDPYNSQAAPVVTPLAVTCSSKLVTSASASLNIVYSVRTLSGNAASCGQADSSSLQTLNEAAITVPATITGAAKSNEATPGPTLSRLSRAMRGEPGQAKFGAAGDGWAPVYFRYLGYIPERMTFAAISTTDPERSYVYFNGNNHGSDPNGSTKFRFTTKVTFGASHNIESTTSIGPSERYNCRGLFATDCVLVATGQAPQNEISVDFVTSTSTGGRFEYNVDTTLPLLTGAPAMNSVMSTELKPGGTFVMLYHDAMPQHEYYYYVEGWGEWIQAYKSPFYMPVCLAGGPGCRLSSAMLL